MTVPGDEMHTSAPPKRGGSPGPVTAPLAPIHCRRDDYLNLPAAAQGGLPCGSTETGQHVDPRQLAVQMAAELAPPDLHIGMNPRKGMVAVPTWFWVEGYDGGALSKSQTVQEQHQTCHLSAVMDADNNVVLDANGQPQTRTDCTTGTTTFVVDVRLQPNTLAWDFGDQHGLDLPCAGDHCGNALGTPFIDPAHPSPIQHPYQWSSLGRNGGLDAYQITLNITFGADFHVSINGESSGGWQALPERTLSWTADHQVQEAQAVLTSP
jgi:hypothetical protein